MTISGMEKASENTDDVIIQYAIPFIDVDKLEVEESKSEQCTWFLEGHIV